MQLLISKDCTGTNSDFVYDTKDKSVLSRADKDLFWMGARNNHLMQYLNIKSYIPLHEEYKNLLKTLNLEKDSIDWRSMLGSDLLKDRIKSILSDLDERQTFVNDYVYKYLPIRLKLFERLTSFIYDNQIQGAIEYLHNNTITGRTIIKKGLNLITLKKENRKKLKSKYVGGAIIEIDIKSLEPRLFLSLVKNIEVEDAYSFLLTEVLNYEEGAIDRKKIKLAFISLLYGASTSKIRSMTSLTVKDINKIKKFLGVREFENKIVNEYQQGNFFENAYGRRINSINAPVNYYVQSTAADYACIIYEQLLETLPDTGIDLIGTIHDAIVLDCQEDKIDEIMEVNSLTEQILNITSYFKVVRHS